MRMELISFNHHEKRLALDWVIISVFIVSAAFSALALIGGITVIRWIFY